MEYSTEYSMEYEIIKNDMFQENRKSKKFSTFLEYGKFRKYTKKYIKENVVVVFLE